MRIAKTVTLIATLIFSALAFELIPPTKVQATDELQDTEWASENLFTTFSFKKGGVVEVFQDTDKGRWINGHYRLNGRSVEMTFEDGARATATISGRKMSVKVTSNSGQTQNYDLTYFQ